MFARAKLCDPVQSNRGGIPASLGDRQQVLNPGFILICNPSRIVRESPTAAVADTKRTWLKSRSTHAVCYAVPGVAIANDPANNNAGLINRDKAFVICVIIYYVVATERTSFRRISELQVFLGFGVS